MKTEKIIQTGINPHSFEFTQDETVSFGVEILLDGKTLICTGFNFSANVGEEPKLDIFGIFVGETRIKA